MLAAGARPYRGERGLPVRLFHRLVSVDPAGAPIGISCADLSSASDDRSHRRFRHPGIEHNRLLRSERLGHRCSRNTTLPLGSSPFGVAAGFALVFANGSDVRSQSEFAARRSPPGCHGVGDRSFFPGEALVEDEWVDGDASVRALFRRHAGVHDGRFPGCQRLADYGHCCQGPVEPNGRRRDAPTRCAGSERQSVVKTRFFLRKAGLTSARAAHEADAEQLTSVGEVQLFDYQEPGYTPSVCLRT